MEINTQARKLARHGQSELAVLSTQCLDRRIPDKKELTAEVAAWEQYRNNHHAKANWQFTTADARVKLARLYPQFESFGPLGASPNCRDPRIEVSHFPASHCGDICAPLCRIG